MDCSDARTAYAVAWRIRYRIPLRWEWWVTGSVLAIEAVRLVVGGRGVLGWFR